MEDVELAIFFTLKGKIIMKSKAIHFLLLNIGIVVASFVLFLFLCDIFFPQVCLFNALITKIILVFLSVISILICFIGIKTDLHCRYSQIEDQHTIKNIEERDNF